MSNTLALLVSPGGVALSVSPGGVDFFYAPGAEDGTATAAGGYGGESKRKWVVRKGGKLEVYASASAAMLALEEPEPAQSTAEAPEQPIDAVQTPAKPEPVQTVTLAEIKAMAKQFDALEEYKAAAQRQQYESLIALFERLIDEEDVELLLQYA